MVDAVSAQGSVSSQISRVQNDRPTASEPARTPPPAPAQEATQKAAPPPPPPPPPADTGRGASVDEVA